MSLEFKGTRKVALKLLGVLSRDHSEDIAARATEHAPRPEPLEVEEDEYESDVLDETV